MSTLSPSLEDYLEAIWVVGLRSAPVRVKDLGEFLKVATSSVVGALKALAERGLVVHERYGYVQLTREGKVRAKEIYERHRTLVKFFNGLLGIELEVAVVDACRIEHHVDSETMRRIEELVKYVESKEEDQLSWLGEFRKTVEESATRRSSKRGERAGAKSFSGEALRLCDLKPGQTARILSVVAEPGIKRRYLEMGLIPGVDVKLERVAPLGDPMDVVLKGYHLSMRKDEARGILVEESRGRMPLSLVSSGHDVEVIEVGGGRGLKSKLARKGISPGVRLRVVSTIGRGPITVSKDGKRETIGYGMARKVLVRSLGVGDSEKR